MESEKLTLFIPPIEPDEVMWSGLPETVEEALEKYVDFNLISSFYRLQSPFLVLCHFGFIHFVFTRTGFKPTSSYLSLITTNHD
jgi:hypothetical protein